jgi:anti-sigma factor RsiW
MNCEIFLDLIGSYVDDTLEEERRAWFRSHLRDCSACRVSALRQDPSLLFDAAQDAPDDLWAIEACVSSVTSRIRQERLERRLYRRRRPWLAAAAAVVVVIAGGFGWRYLGGGGGSMPGPAIEASHELEARTSPPMVEVEAPDGDVRVYQFATDGNNDTAMYFIVDPALEL